MWLRLRNTASRGRAAEPAHATGAAGGAGCRADARRSLRDHFAPAFLPTLRRMTSSAYGCPCPCRARAGAARGACAAVWPSSALSAPRSVMAICRSISAVTPSGSGKIDRMRVAEGELDVLALHLRAVADADDLELALEAVLDAGHHVGDQRAGQAVERARACARRRRASITSCVVARSAADMPGRAPAAPACPWAPRRARRSAVDLDLDALRECAIGFLADSRHGGSLPDVGEDFAADLLLARRRGRSARPRDVDSTATPMPARIDGILSWPT